MGSPRGYPGSLVSYNLLLKSAVAYVIEISINDTDTFSDVRVRPPAPVGLPIPIRVNDIFFGFWQNLLGNRY